MVERIFDNKQTQEGFELTQRVEALLKGLGSESEDSEFRRISFKGLDNVRGRIAIMGAGMVVYTNERGTVLVPDRTVGILDTLKIAYKEVVYG